MPNPLSVFLREMFSRHRERLAHALTNRHARHHDDKFAPAVKPIELVHRLYVGVCFADARFHLHRKISAVKPFTRHKPVATLHPAQIVKQLRVVELDWRVRPDCKFVVAAQAEIHRLPPLSAEHVANCRRRLRLKLLVLELKLHRTSTSVSGANCRKYSSALSLSADVAKVVSRKKIFLGRRAANS